MNNNASPVNNRILKEYNFNDHVIKLEQVADVEKLVDEIADDEFNKDERLPYWAEVWPSARALAEYFLNNLRELKDKNVLELGCGVGLVGIAATLAGAKVTFSDYEKEAIDFTKNNFFLNFNMQPKTMLMDWREPIQDNAYEIIIAADILYEKRFLKPVHNTLEKLLTKNGKVYIAEPNRTIAKPFFEMMKNGFELVEKKTSSNNNSVSLYMFKKC
jgi:ETFB lysine methyltransferase